MRKRSQHMWPWTLLVISVGIIFFQLGKVSRSSQPYRRAPNETMMASPVFPVPRYKTNVAPKKDEPRLRGEQVAKKAKKARAPKLSRQRPRPPRAAAAGVGVGPKIVPE